MHQKTQLPTLPSDRLISGAPVARPWITLTCALSLGAWWPIAALAENTLVGRAVLPAKTFAPGPGSGSLLGTNPINGITPPFASQPVQGFSGALDRGDGSFDVLEDNGYGAKNNSAAFNLRIYGARPDFHTAQGGSAGVALEGFIEISDPKRGAGSPITNETAIGRTLTGADFDIESIQRANDGSLWIGDEFGPFVLHFSADGTLLDAPFATPGVKSDSNPFIPSGTGNLPNSRGFEGMAISPDGRHLYPMLEGALKSDADPKLTLRIFEFDIAAKEFTENVWNYRMEAPGNALGDLQAINDQEFLIIERDGGQGTAAVFKKIFRIDLSVIDAAGFVAKTEVVDLLRIADPDGISTSVPAPRPGDIGLGNPFQFPFVTIEDVVVLSPQELLVINDNNFPFSIGRNPNLPDDNELIRIRLDEELDVDTDMLLRPPVLTAREDLLSAAHLALSNALTDAIEEAVNAVALIRRAEELADGLEHLDARSRLARLRATERLTERAIDDLEDGKANKGAERLILAHALLGQVLAN